VFIDVLHHTNDPVLLLREAARVARNTIVIKDHTLDGFAAGPTLRFMDRIGNRRYNVALPYNYWPKQQWLSAFEALGPSRTEHARPVRVPGIGSWTLSSFRAGHVCRVELASGEQRS
jgi:hypothetical protein